MGAHRAARRARFAGRPSNRLAVGFVALPLAGVVVGPIFLLGSSASAGTVISTATKVTGSNWFWDKSAQLPSDVTKLLPVPVPLPGDEIPIPNGILVPEGDLAVSFRGDPAGAPDRETYLTFGLGGAATGATVRSFTFTLKVDTASSTNLNSKGVPLIACFPSRAWEAGTGGAAYSDKPKDNCASAPVGKFDATKQTYTFEVKAFAQDWLDNANIGVGIRQAKSQTSPFILSFTGAKTVTATIAYENPVAGGATPPVVADKPNVSSVQTAPDPGFVSSVSAEPLAQIPAVPTAPMPGVTVAPNTFSPAGGTHAIGATSFDGRFWLSTLIGALGVALLAAFAGRRPVAAKVTSTQVSRLSQVLSARGSLHAAHTAPPASSR